MEIRGKSSYKIVFWILLNLFFNAVMILGDTPLSNEVNDYDKFLNFTCPEGEYISQIFSVHDNHHEDRRFQFACVSDKEGILIDPPVCWWTEELNKLDKTLDSTCDNEGIISGFQSHHWSHEEDRRWRFYCCQPVEKLHGCRHTEFINDYDEEMNYQIDNELWVIHGVYSIHDDHHEDRRWKLKICKTSVCKVEEIKYLDHIMATFKGTKILAIASGQICEAGHDVGFTIGRTEEVRQSNTLSKTKTTSHAFRWGIEIGWSAEIHAEKYFVKKKYTMSGKIHAEHTYTNTKSVEESSTVMGRDIMERAMTIKLSERSGGVVVIMSDEYEIMRTEVDAEVTYACSDGRTHTIVEKMAYSGNRYENVHVEPLLRMIPASGRCDFDSSQCLKHIGLGANYINNLEEIYHRVDECLGIDHTTSELCCPLKIQRGIQYKHVGELDHYDRYECLDNCLYTEVNSNFTKSFCFMEGDLPSACSFP